MERITSRHNDIVKEFRALADPTRARRQGGDHDRMLLDGPHLVQEALDAGVPIDILAIREDLLEGTAAALAGRAASRGTRVLSMPDAVVSAISPVRQPAGIVAIARRGTQTLDAALDDPPQFVLILADIQDPGNVGAILRVAEACGATGVATTEGTADPYGWKALRGSMGSAFRLRVAVRQPLLDAARRARARGLQLWAAVPRGGTPLPTCDLRRGTAVMLGGEGSGLPPDLVAFADERLTIPMRRPVESLNVATSAALIAYEAQRQRTEGGA